MLLAANVNDPLDRVSFKERFGWLVPKAFGLTGRQISAASVVRAIADLKGGRSISHDWLPQMVTFDNDKIPMSVKPVDPQNMATAFGPGVQFVEASVAITKEPITTGIESRLRWLEGDVRGQALDPDARGFGETFPQKIRKSWFRRKIDA